VISVTRADRGPAVDGRAARRTSTTGGRERALMTGTWRGRGCSGRVPRRARRVCFTPDRPGRSL